MWATTTGPMTVRGLLYKTKQTKKKFRSGIARKDRKLRTQRSHIRRE